MGEGLKRHTRLEREAVVDALVPLIICHMGHQLVALGVGGCFARRADGPYADLELIGFVKKPSGPRAPVRFVHDGLGIDIRFPTRQEFLDSHKLKIGAAWPFTARTVLVPLINDAFVRELNAMPYNNAAEDRMRALGEFWPEIQDAAARLLTAVETGNAPPAQYLYWQTVEKFCIALSILNGQPFTSRVAMFGEARQFSLRPTGFEDLLIPAGIPVDEMELARRALRMVWEMERLLSAHGAVLQAPGLEAFVCEQSFGDILRGSLHVEHFAHKAPKHPARGDAQLHQRPAER
jgi:hypothetical protein